MALVGAGASLAARNKDGNTPLHLAAFMNQLSTMEVGGEHHGVTAAASHLL